MHSGKSVLLEEHRHLLAARAVVADGDHLLPGLDLGEARRQLAPGGRLFAVVGEAPVMAARLVAVTAPGAWHSTDLFETVIAPLTNAERPSRFRF